MIKTNKYWRWFENAVFIFAFFYISWDWVSNFFLYYIINPLYGKAVDAKGEKIHTIVTDVKDQFHQHTYHDTFMSIVWMAIYVITLWEIGRLIYEGFKKETNNKLFFPKVKVCDAREV